MYQFTDGGLTNVWLANGYEVKTTPYGDAVAFHDLDGLIKAICGALADKKSTLTGEEFRYLRQAICLSQASVGLLMDKSAQAIAIWEKSGEAVPKLADFAMRAIYKDHANGNETVKNLVEALNITERTLHIVMRETPKGWEHEEKQEPAEATA